MGHKVHPIGFRIGIIKSWQSRWFATKNYTAFVLEDFAIRQAIQSKVPGAEISRIEIDRSGQEVTATIHTARPGVVIGRGGQRVDELRRNLEALTGKKVRLNIQEIREPELDAALVARHVAGQLERRVAHRRAIKQAIFRTMERGAKGIKIICSGRLAGAEIARRESDRAGRVPLHTLRADIDFGIAEAHTTLGRIGVKVWVYRGDVLPELEETEPKDIQPARVPAMAQPAAVGAAISQEVKNATTEASEVSESPQGKT